MNEFEPAQSRVEAALQNMLGAANELEPAQSRIEKILYNMLGYNYELEPTQSRIEALLKQILEQGGPGGGGVDPESITLVTLNVSQNGTTNAPTGKAYNKVVAAVPNSYGASDEGKVVKNGALAAQGSATVTENGPVDTTEISAVTVAVPVPVLDTLTAIANGTYTPTAGHAFGSVIVNVPSSGGGTDLAAADVYVADYLSTTDLTITLGAVNRYQRYLVGG